MTKLKAIVFGFIGAALAASLLGLGYIAYTDHAMLWRVVQALSQPAPPTPEKR